MAKKTTKIKATDIVEVGAAVGIKDIPERLRKEAEIERAESERLLKEAEAKFRANNPDLVEEPAPSEDAEAEAAKPEEKEEASASTYDDILAMINKATGGK